MARSVSEDFICWLFTVCISNMSFGEGYQSRNQTLEKLKIRSVHFHPAPFTRPSFSIFRGSGSKTIWVLSCGYPSRTTSQKVVVILAGTTSQKSERNNSSLNEVRLVFVNSICIVYLGLKWVCCNCMLILIATLAHISLLRLQSKVSWSYVWNC